ncbi:pyridoxamine 5'-phosphate oxidase-domain-containing protein [Mycena maculata]|uniref:Pyridoxamine 5'-phosphate oxidase-domain-containing protein n=1 Tax=Mycena maculata TaxID=230809 RepID=A0AAD7JGW8_9AGAR|nr:pyridoxamine 5'-phosphate oxidase-domain-containing protein [Mycena maculata]
MQMTIPRWKAALEKALAAHSKDTVIQLASIDPATPVPHVRSLIFRSFVSPTDNPAHPLLLSTTDVRTPKTSQMIANPHVQIVWWIAGTQEQYRIAGRSHIVPAPGHALHRHFTHTVGALSDGVKFDWEAKRIAVFKSMSPVMKASWCRPVPGSRLEGGQDEAKKWPVTIEEPKPGDAEAKRLWDMSLSNFALVIIEPQDVDYVELAPVPNQRTRFWRTGGVWNEEALVP